MRSAEAVGGLSRLRDEYCARVPRLESRGNSPFGEEWDRRVAGFALTLRYFLCPRTGTEYGGVPATDEGNQDLGA